MVRQGADVVDVGGESSRPGAAPVSEGEELRRVVPVVEALAPHVRVSVDTVKPAVAEAAMAAGATLVNDISASLWPVAAEAGVGWVAMHMQGTPRTMQARPALRRRGGRGAAPSSSTGRDARSHGGVRRGVGRPRHRLRQDRRRTTSSLLRHLPELVAEGFPVLVGTSRKSFLGRLAPGPAGEPLGRGGARLRGSMATATWAMLRRARRWCGSTTWRRTVQAATLVGRRAAALRGP